MTCYWSQTLELGHLQKEMFSWFLALVRVKLIQLAWKYLITSACGSGHTNELSKTFQKVLFHLSLYLVSNPVIHSQLVTAHITM